MMHRVLRVKFFRESGDKGGGAKVRALGLPSKPYSDDKLAGCWVAIGCVNKLRRSDQPYVHTRPSAGMEIWSSIWSAGRLGLLMFDCGR